MDTQKKNDLAYGLFSENLVEPIIQDYFGATIVNTKLTHGKYCPYDYESEDKKTRYELKSRRINHDTYPTILIGKNKIIKGIKGTDRFILLFLFNDGLYFIQYEPLLFSGFTTGSFTRVRDGCDEKQTVVHIPIQHLKKINL